MKFELNGRMGHRGKRVISQATVMKVLGIKDLIFINERFPWIFEIRNDQFGIISVKQSLATGDEYIQSYRFVTDARKRLKKYEIRIYCDTYFFLCFDLDWRNIEKIYIVPNQGRIKNSENITISKNAYSSIYDEFIIDHTLYNDKFHDLMSFIEKDGNTVLVDLKDVKKWLKL